MTLNDEQRAAVETQGQDVCVVAGPGSGKTRVLTHRFEWLVETQGILPHRILTITFTEKAATEIKKRLVDTFRAHPEVREQIERAYVSTVHGFCARLLREHAIAAGVDPEFRVLDENAAVAMQDGLIEEVLDELCRERPAEMRSLLDNLYVSSNPGGQQPDLSVALRSIYEAMRISGKPPELARSPVDSTAAVLERVTAPLLDALQSAGAGGTPAQRRRVGELRAWLASVPRFAEARVEHFQWFEEFPDQLRGLPGAVKEVVQGLKADIVPEAKGVLIRSLNAPLYEFLAGTLEKIDCRYRRAKQGSGSLDFNDLEESAIALLSENPTARQQIASSFDEILMDELQDTNPLQWTLIDLIRQPRRFFAVGDINQSIFGFRHAEPAVFRRYRSGLLEAGERVHELRENHRSRPEVLAAVNAVFGSVPGVEAHVLQPSAKYPAKVEPSLEILVASGARREEASRREAEWIAARILELKRTLRIGKGGAQRAPQFFDFAVLGRSLNALEPVREALEAAGIPSLLAGGRTFYETREVRDIIQWLTILVNPRDEVSLVGVLRSPLVGVADETLLKMRVAAPGNLADAVNRIESPAWGDVDAGDVERLRHLGRQLAELRSLRDSVSPDRLASRALDECDYYTGLTAHERSNIEKFLTLLREGWERQPQALAERLEELERLRAAGSEPEAPPDDSDAVHLMTIHRSKGLEYPIVFVPALQRSPDRSKPVLCYDRERGLGVRWRNPTGGEGIADDVHLRHVAGLKAREDAEEDRLLYVAVTRAEEHLVLSWSRAENDRGSWNRLVQNVFAFTGDELDEEPRRYRVDAAGIDIRLLRTRMDPPRQWAEVATQASEPEYLAPVPGAGGQDGVVPVTAVAAFSECPRCYFLKRYLNAPPVAQVWEESSDTEDGGGSDEPDAGELGRQVHALLAGLPVPEPAAEARALADRFASTPLGARVARAQRVEREFDFVMALDDVVLRGQIDLWFEEAGELVLVDYKTDRLGAGDGSRLERYALQLRLYALALGRLLGRVPDIALLYLLRTGEMVPVDLSAPLLDQARAAVADLRRAQAAFRFPPRESGCEQCGGRD